MKTIRCKFLCQSVEKSKHWDRQKGFLYSAKFTPVTGDTDENKAFWAATPSGSLEVGTVTESGFEPGKTYYINIVEAQDAN